MCDVDHLTGVQPAGLQGSRASRVGNRLFVPAAPVPVRASDPLQLMNSGVVAMALSKLIRILSL